jgi:hypothetical protein
VRSVFKWECHGRVPGLAKDILIKPTSV